MLVSLKWLNDYIDLSNVSVEEVIEKLTSSGLEVDEVIDLRKKYENIVVGYVEQSEKHPDADKLSVCKVSDGEKVYDVVCGAPNVAAGQKVAFAKVGAIIPDGGFKIKKAKIRGAVSEGMICAGDELELNNDHSGILVLDESLEPGTPFATAVGMDDVIFEVAITPNRSDALSHLGIARDLAALFNKDVKVPKFTLNESDERADSVASVEIENSNACPRYSARVVKNVTVSESPSWLQEKLTAVGLRPINNIVDITNYVLYEVGQPLHAFDLNYLEGNKIIVKNAEDGDKFITLDSKERELKSNNLMICDAVKPVAIAGVMGGENSEVTEQTKDVLIESAYFDASSIRKTAKQLGLQTDASYRFERGTNPEITTWAADRAAFLMASLAGGTVLKGVIDVYPNPIIRKEIKLRYNRINKILGYSVAPETVREIITKLDLVIVLEEAEYIIVEVPLFRPDIEREIDLIEEVARIYGYDKIPDVSKVQVTLQPKVDQTKGKEKARDILVALGFNEIITNSLLNDKLAEEFGNPIKLMNPQSSEMTHTRPSLLPGMLQTISRNLKVKEENLKLFEIGHIFNKINETISNFEDFVENESLLFAITGLKEEKQWYTNPVKFDFYDLKGDLELFATKLFAGSNIRIEYQNEESNFYDYGIKLKVNGKQIGSGGKLKDNILKEFDIKQEVFTFELNLSDLSEVKKRSFKTLLKYPKVYRDMAFVLDKNIDSDKVVNAIKKGSSKLLKNIKLFDIFENKSLGENKKSVAFKLEYYDYNRTLTEEEVDKDFWNVIEKIKKQFGAELRG